MGLVTVNAETHAGGHTWRDLPAAQQPDWPDQEALRDVIAELESYPPLVFAGECDQLRERLGAVARGEAFLLQGGDCAEAFDAVSAEHIRNKLKTLLQMGAVLTYAGSVPVVKVGRIAYQYSKPRSKPTETRDGVTLPTYRGDSVNGFEFTEAARIPDPERLKRMYHASAATLNLVRAFTTGGYADLRQVHAWNQDFVKSSPSGQRYEALAREIDRAMNFMNACGVDPEEFRTVEFYASHEALVLDYESSLTRVDSRTGNLYDVSGHMVWIGERTRQLDGAHIEFASRIRNPIGVKLGPTTTAEDALTLIERLDPEREPGRLRPSSPAWERTRSATSSPSWSRRSPPPARRSPGSATRCTATPSRRPPVTRPGASTMCWTRSRASSRSTRASVRTRAVSTSS